MNLAALWAHERARVNALPPAPPLATDVAVPKKKASVASLRRDDVFQQLADASALPAAPEPLVRHANEFAIEYATHAPRRLVVHAPHHATEAPTHASAASEPESTTPSVPKVAKRKPSALPSVPKVSAVAASSFPRRNPRKRGNTNSLELAPHAFRPYVGDMFSTRGDYVEGMLYMSRMKRSHHLAFGHEGALADFMPAARMKDAVADAFSAAVAAAAAGNLHATAGDSNARASTKNPALAVSNTSSAVPSGAALLSELSPEEIIQLRQRQRCSSTLSNWSSNPENARVMVEENVVQALILLCKASDGDRVTKLHCVTTFMNLSHVDALRSELVQQGAVKTLVDIANDSDDDKTLRTACAVTLCNLCCCLEGEEEILVDDGAVSALSLLINEHPKTAPICLGALYNLTCVREPYHKIESVLKVFATLASSTPPSPSNVDRDEIIAKALCNLSNFKRVRLRLMEEGMVSVALNLIHANHAFIQQLLAYVFLNLSAMRACRSELVSKGCLGALIALANAAAPQDSDTKCLVALTLWNLSKEPGNRLRMVFEGFLVLVNDLCRGTASADGSVEAVRAVCARAVYNVSCSDETRVKLVERDAVSILSTLAQRCVGDESKKMCTLSLCNLLSVQQAAADIVTAGAITSLIELSMVTEPPQPLDTRQLFSKALYGLCDMASTRAAVVQAGIVPALIHLCSIASPPPVVPGAIGARHASLLSEIRARCTAALACLAGDDALSSAVATPAVTRCVVQILVQERFNVAIERFSCACLSLLCRDEQCARVVADEGALEAVLSTCLESQDVDTKASCCHVLASMSCHQSCCMALVHMGGLPVLATLAKTGLSKSSIQRCCAITLANLSSEKAIRAILVTSNIVPLLSLLSNSYSEDSQRDCARILCNLSTVDGHEAALAHEGALGVLMMISMVRALQPATKETCVRAFANLLTPTTAPAMIHEGIVKVLPVFAGLTSGTDGVFAASVVQAVSVIYGKLLQYAVGREALTTEPTALRALVSLRPHRDDAQDDRFYESLLGELVYDDRLRVRSIDAGVIDALDQLATLRLSSGRSVAQIAFMLFTLAKDDATRQAAASVTSLSTLSKFLQCEAPDKDCMLYSVSTICHLAWHDATRVHLKPDDITQPLTRLLRRAVDCGVTAPSESAVATCLLTLCSLSDSLEHRSAMLQEGLVTHLFDLMHLPSLDANRLLPLACTLFRQLSHAPAFEAALTRSSAQSAIATKLFCALATHATRAGDVYAALDCADVLCSITFLCPTSQKNASGTRPVPFVRRQSQPQRSLRGTMAASSSIPPATLISPEVLEAIGILVSDGAQLVQTRWRCMAALYAFSCIAEYRHTLVRLGCTRLLVNEAARSALTASSVELATLRCCAGALCNLTIVSCTNATVNAQAMIEEDAVPALIQLAARESDEIREYCTLALSNLSTQSPKVESGAVSALLSLSLQSGTSSAFGMVDSQVGVSRPPLVLDARYKESSQLPDHRLERAVPEEILSRKYEAAQGQASKPPPPLLPTLSADLAMVGGLGRNPSTSQDPTATDTADAATARDDVAFRRRRTSSIGDLLGISPVATPASGRGDSSGGSAVVDGDLRAWQTLVFPKIDPVESRALSMEMDGASDPVGQEEPSAATAIADGKGDGAANGSTPLDEGRTEGCDVRLDSDTATRLKPKAKAFGGLNALTPLARVVVRKSQTSHAINKLKGIRAPRGANTSSPSLPLATVDEAHEPNTSTNSTMTHSSSGRSLPLPVPKRNSLQKTATAKALPQTREVASPVTIVPDPEPVEQEEPSVSVAAAAAAALLYSTGPPPPAHITTEATTKKATAKAKAKPLEASRPVVPVVSTIEDVQAQVKLLGLWH